MEIKISIKHDNQTGALNDIAHEVTQYIIRRSHTTHFVPGLECQIVSIVPILLRRPMGHSLSLYLGSSGSRVHCSGLYEARSRPILLSDWFKARLSPK